MNLWEDQIAAAMARARRILPEREAEPLRWVAVIPPVPIPILASSEECHEIHQAWRLRSPMGYVGKWQGVPEGSLGIWATPGHGMQKASTSVTCTGLVFGVERTILPNGNRFEVLFPHTISLVNGILELAKSFYTKLTDKDRKPRPIEHRPLCLSVGFRNALGLLMHDENDKTGKPFPDEDFRISSLAYSEKLCGDSWSNECESLEKQLRFVFGV